MKKQAQTPTIHVNASATSIAELKFLVHKHHRQNLTQFFTAVFEYTLNELRKKDASKIKGLDQSISEDENIA